MSELAFVNFAPLRILANRCMLMNKHTPTYFFKLANVVIKKVAKLNISLTPLGD
jgi:hypothetical protein